MFEEYDEDPAKQVRDQMHEEIRMTRREFLDARIGAAMMGFGAALISVAIILYGLFDKVVDYMAAHMGVG